MIQYQADEHPLVPTDGFRSREEYALYLIHLTAYEEAARLATGKRVLDLGCNNGYGTERVAHTAARAAGVDVSPQSIEAAQQRESARDIEFRVIDGSRLPFDDESFDLVISFQVIEHIADYAPYLSEIRRVLATGGSVVFTTPNGPLRLDPDMKPWNPFHVREFSPSELRDLLQTWFPQVEIRGLFAGEELYDVEFGRMQRSRENARRRYALEAQPSYRLKQSFVRVLRGVVPASVRARIRSAVGSETTTATGPDVAVQSFIARHSTADLFYRNDALDRALDLMAICTKS